MKRLVPFFCLSLLLAHLVGFYVYFALRLEAIHESSRAAIRLLPDDRLDRLEFTPSEFRRIGGPDADEFRHLGKMYDVARIEYRSGIVVVYALHDKDEDDLLSFISAVVETAGQDDRPAPTALTRFLSLIFLPASAPAVPAPDGTPVLHLTKAFIRFEGGSLLPAVPPPLS